MGIVGCGWAGALRADAIRRLPGFDLVAVTDVRPESARALADRHGAVAEPDWEALIRRDDVQGVIVATPPHTHLAPCAAALDRGKHVLCEKPMARTPDECREMLQAAERGGGLLATGFNYRFYPAILKAREILDSGLIGELDHIRSYAGHPGGDEFTHSWVHDVDVMGGGALLDNGIHIVDLTRYFLGEVAEVKGYASGHVWQFPGCEDNGFALLISPQGKIASVQASWTEWRGYRFALEIYGTRGCVRASYPPMMTRVVYREEGSGRRRTRRFLFPMMQIAERLRSYRWTMLQSFLLELESFSEKARGGDARLALGLDGLRSVQIAHAVYRSAADGSSVRLDDAQTDRAV